MNDSVHRFVCDFGDASFHHKETLIEGMKKNEVSFESLTEDACQRASDYLELYVFRLRGMDRRLGNRAHVSDLKSDVRALCAGFAAEPDDLVDLLIFTKDPYYTYSVFVGHESRAVFGCIRGVDNRLVDADTRRMLWGESSGE